MGKTLASEIYESQWAARDQLKSRSQRRSSCKRVYSDQQLLQHGELMQELTPEGAPQRVFKAGQFWSSNVSGAALGGAGAVILMSVMMGIVVWMNPDRQNILFAATLTLILVASVLCFLPGNMGAVYPYAVAVQEGKGLQLYAPLKKLYIPIEDVRDVRKSFLGQGYACVCNGDTAYSQAL